MKPVCTQVIVVEGKYDKIRLDSLLEATVITTEGFGIFRDATKKDLIRRLAAERGIVVLCDSDGGGALIRSHLHTVTGKVGVTDLYIPCRPGKEKRKSAPGKSGLLGVEGIDNETLLSLFEKSGLIGGSTPPPRYTKTELYRLGYFGKEDSRKKREDFLRKNDLPTELSSNAFLEIVNLLNLPL